jgi:hypothetical protein
VEYVDSQSVASIVSEYGSILKYLNSLATSKKGSRSIVADFAKSCGEYVNICITTKNKPCIFPLTPASKKLLHAAGRCSH